jgi:hypothetical protein
MNYENARLPPRERGWKAARSSAAEPGGAGGRGRTDTLLRVLDFESSASANSATPALRASNNRLQRPRRRATGKCPAAYTALYYKWSGIDKTPNWSLSLIVC